MAKAGHAYPQVEPGVAALMDSRVVSCAPGVPVARALVRARAAGATVVALGPGSAARVSELARAAAWGLDRRPVGEVAWRNLPSVAAGASEIDARRRLRAGASLILVRRGSRVIGVVDRERVEVPQAESSVLAQLEQAGTARPHPGVRRWGSAGAISGPPQMKASAGAIAGPPQVKDARLWLLRVAGKIGEGLAAPTYAVGGFVRDLLTGAASPDVDLVVEGDGVAFARRLAEEIGGTVLVHRSFGTASIEGGRAPAGAGLDGVALGRVDVASARREHYSTAGALPEVERADLLEDLRRRDFSVNAMALALAPDRFGRLLDPLGGQADVRRRRLRALHPLSFVEDPTRVFRAARYASRLGFRPDAATLAAIRLAVGRPGYAALSGQRLWREIELAAAEPRARQVFERLVRWKATSLWNIDGASSRHLAAAERLGRWAKSAGLVVDPAELSLLALTLGRPAEVVERGLDRLALAGEPRARIEAGALAGPLARRLEARRLPPSAVGELLEGAPEAAALAAWLRGGARARRRIQWYLAHGRAVRPRLTGRDLLALGVPGGPRVGAALGMLRRRRLDGGAGSLAEERELVKEWLTSGKEA
jgi:tRNA nucleotidyltransferase (CCA-adding enzyme)